MACDKDHSVDQTAEAICVSNTRKHRQRAAPFRGALDRRRAVIARVLVRATARARFGRHARARARTSLRRQRTGGCSCVRGVRGQCRRICHHCHRRAFSPLVAGNAAEIAHYFGFHCLDVTVDGGRVRHTAFARAVTHCTASIAHVVHPGGQRRRRSRGRQRVCAILWAIGGTMALFAARKTCGIRPSRARLLRDGALRPPKVAARIAATSKICRGTNIKGR